MAEANNRNVPFDAKVQRASALGARLSTLTDGLNGRLATFEKVLVALKLGVEADVSISSEVEDENGYVKDLSFRRVGNEWRLVVIAGVDHGDAGDFSVTPLIQMSKETRLLASSRLMDLFDALVLKAEAQASEMEEQLQFIDDLTSAIAAGCPALPPEAKVVSSAEKTGINGGRSSGGVKS